MSEISGYLDITPCDFKEVYLKSYQHALTRSTRSVEAKKIMITSVITVKPEFSLEKVAELMAVNHISGMPIVDEKEKLLGIISERHFLELMVGRKSANLMEIILQCLRAKNLLMATVLVKSAKDIMRAPVITEGGDDFVDDVSNLFASKTINRDPVVNSEGQIIEIVSPGDLVRASVVGGSE